MTTIICPKCSNKFSSENITDDLKLNCPHCSSEFSIEDEPAEIKITKANLLNTEDEPAEIKITKANLLNKEEPELEEPKLEEPEEEALSKGTDIGGFEIIRVIGEGSMGIVYLATQKSMNRNVALKILKKSVVIKNKAGVKQFLNEAKMTGKLEHSNIVSAIDAGESKGLYYLAMNFVDGETLEERLEQGQIISEKMSLKYIMQMTVALEYAYSKHQLIHKDIKPSNIMVNSDNTAYLLDMGIAQNIGSIEEKEQMIDGSPFYMSPEQARADKLDWTTDQYSLGVTLYNLIVGKPPYTSSDVMEILELHKTAEFPEPTDINPDVNISKQTISLLKKMMSKTPDERFLSWKDLQKTLKKAIGVKKGGNTGTVINTGKRKREFKKKAGVFATLSKMSFILLIIGGGSYFAWTSFVKIRNENALKASQFFNTYWEEESKNEEIDYQAALMKAKQTLSLTKNTKYYDKILNSYNGIKYEIDTKAKIEKEFDETYTNLLSMFTAVKDDYSSLLGGINKNIKLFGAELSQAIPDNNKVEAYETAINTQKLEIDEYPLDDKCKDIKKGILLAQTEDTEKQSKLDKLNERVDKLLAGCKSQYSKIFASQTNSKDIRKAVLAKIEADLQIEQEKVNREKELDALIDRNSKILGMNFVMYGRKKVFTTMLESLILPRTEEILLEDDKEDVVAKAQEFDKWNDKIIDYGKSAREAWQMINNSDTKYAGVQLKSGKVLKIKGFIVDLNDGTTDFVREDLRRLSPDELSPFINKIKDQNKKAAFAFALAIGGFQSAKQMASGEEENKLATEIIKGYLYARYKKAKKDGDTAMKRLKDEYGSLSEFKDLNN